MNEAKERLEVASVDLVSRKGHEPTLRRLFKSYAAGQWMPLREPLATDPIGEIVMTWLPDPSDPDGAFRLLLFYEPVSGWSMTAIYNVERLRRSSGSA